MWIGVIIVLCSFAIAVTAKAAKVGGQKGGIIWGAVHFVISVIATIIAWLSRPYLFPSWLIPGDSLFDRQLTESQMVLSFLLDKLFKYGPLAAVTGIIVVFVCLGGPRSEAARRPGRKIDWKGRLG